VRQDKDAGREVGEPIGSTGGKSFPPHLCSLTAPDEDIPPQQVDTSLKDAQLGRVAGHSMVLVITQHNSAKPCTDCGRAIMLPALKLSLDGFQLRDHPLLRRDPPDDECSITDAPPTEVSKTQERKGLCFPSPRCFRLRAANRPNSISRVLSGCNSKPNFARRSRNSFRKRSASVRC
jgi:hypothetical protein